MAQQLINVGAAANDNTGDTLRISFIKTNDNFSEIYGGLSFSSTNVTLNGELRGPATLVIDPAAVGDNTGEVVIKGNLEVNGTTKASGQLYTGTSNPTNTTRLNYDGHFYATNFYGNGSNLTNVAVTPTVSSSTSVTSSLSWNSDNFGQYVITAQAENLTINADSGTPVDGKKMLFRFKDDGTARTLTWTTGVSKGFRTIGLTLPVSTISGKIVYVGCVYNDADSRWDVVSVAQE